MLTDMLLIGGWMFWIVLGVVAAIECALLSIDDDGPLGLATGIAIITFLAILLFSDAFVGVKLAWVCAGIVAYALCGVLWSIKKWYSFVVEQRDAMKQRYNAAVDQTKPGFKTWEAYSKDSRPSAAGNKQRIVAWMTLWPWSVSWWVLTWPRRAFTWLYERLTTIFDRITERIFASA